MSANAVLIGMGALDGKELFAIEGSENWRSTSDDLEEREKWPEKGRQTKSNRLAAINTANTAIQLVGIMSRFPVRTERGPPKHLHVEK